jgi:hypothetical protein
MYFVRAEIFIKSRQSQLYNKIFALAWIWAFFVLSQAYSGDVLICAVCKSLMVFYSRKSHGATYKACDFGSDKQRRRIGQPE